jgi:hypothetical protein
LACDDGGARGIRANKRGTIVIAACNVDFVTSQLWPRAMPIMTDLARIGGQGNRPFDPRRMNLKICNYRIALDWFDQAAKNDMWQPEPVQGTKSFVVFHLFDKGTRLTSFTNTVLADLQYIVSTRGKDKNDIPYGEYQMTVKVEDETLAVEAEHKFHFVWFGKGRFRMEEIKS